MNFVFSISLFKPVVWSLKAAAPEVPTPGTDSNSIGSALAPDTKTVIFSSEKVTIFYQKLTIFNKIVTPLLAASGKNSPNFALTGSRNV